MASKLPVVLLPKTRSGLVVVFLLTFLALVYLLGLLDARVGPWLFPHLSPYALILAGLVGLAAVRNRPSPTTPSPLFTMAVAILLLIGLWPLSRWQAGLRSAPSPLRASVYRLGEQVSLSARAIPIESLALRSRSELRGWTGHGTNMVVHIDGQIRLPADGLYRFHLSCDDRCWIRIGGETVAEQSGRGRADVRLTRGLSSFEFRYQQDQGPASFGLSWDRPGWIELLPFRQYVGDREEHLTAETLSRRSWSTGGFLVVGLAWSALFSMVFVGLCESRRSLLSELVSGLKWLRAAQPKPPETSDRFRAVDLGVVLSFILLAVGYQLGAIQSEPPYALLTGDAANLASFAAGLDHPGWFTGDPLLGDPDVFAYYRTIHVPLLRELTRYTGDYGTSFISLLGVHVLLQSIGFYLLGRLLFGSRYWAWLLAIASLMRVDLNLAENWGIHRHAVPRLTFQALWPFLLAAAYHWRSRPRVWPWLMVGIGLLMYVHPVSTPAWAFALWLGFLLFLPQDWSWARRLGTVFLLGLIFLLVSAPFLAGYLGRGSEAGLSTGTPRGLPFQEVQDIIAARFADGFLDLPRAFVDFADLWTDPTRPGRWLFWLWALAGGVLVCWIRREDRSVALVATWLVGLVAVTLVIPVIDHELARARGSFPLQYDLVRGVRYLIPLMLMFTLWPLAEISRKTRGAPSGRGLVPVTGFLGAMLVAVWIHWHPPALLQNLVGCMRSGRLACGDPRWPPFFEALVAVRELTPVGAPILATDLDLQIRYYALRPVVYSYKDGGVFSMAAHRKLLIWNEHKRRLSRALYTNDPDRRLGQLMDLARGLDARYLLVKHEEIRGLAVGAAPFLWKSRAYALLEVTLADREEQPAPLFRK